jgi:large subunit ribosomal protein L9
MAIKVMLTSNIQNIGNIGTIKEVSKGFARNYLIPKKLAIEINKKNINKVKKNIERIKYDEVRLINIAKELATKLNKLKLFTQIKIGDNNKTFGVITKAKIAHLLHDSGFQIDKHQIILHKDIKEVGEYTINIKLHPKVTAQFNLSVINE